MHWTEKIKHPERKYGTVLFYWWCGEELTKEKLLHQLSLIKEYSVAGVQINYCHSYTGGNSYGLTYPGSPAVFSEEWWELLDWFTEQCRKYGIKVSLSDYTLSGVGQGYYTDEILADHPQYIGKRLCAKRGADGVLTVSVETVETSVNPIKRGIGELVCRYFFEKFEKNTRFSLGEEFDFFFSDELNFGIDGYLWDEEFEAEFFAVKGYDIKEHYRELFADEGDYIRVRTDYYDVMIELMNRNYFGVIYDFHEKRGMTYGCDHGSRGLDPAEFGSYFSTQKYNQGPGCDQPALRSDIIKNKVAASIANVNCRPRVWLEGFYGSGWGTTSEMLTDAICRNYAMGHNLLALHGTYYTTLGGFWEWAPPCNLIRMPYREATAELLDAVARMSYIMSCGYRYTKVAVHYPTASLQCGLGGDDVREAFDTAEYLYKNGVDFDFVDDEALGGAIVDKSGLRIANNTYECIVFPKSAAVRESTAAVQKCLADTSAAVFYGEEKENILKAILVRCPDVTVEGETGDVYVSHRVVGEDDVYMIYGVGEGKRIHIEKSGFLYTVDPVSGDITAVDAEIARGGATVTCGRTKLPVLILLRTSEKLVGAVAPAAHTPGTVREAAVLDEFDIKYDSILDNKFGDYSLPAYDGVLPLEVRGFEYIESDTDIPPTEAESRRVTYGVGAYYKCAAAYSADELEALLADADAEMPVRFDDYEISLRYGKPNDPGVQGYHGLKGIVTDDFLTLGRQRETLLGYDYVDDGRIATVYIFDVDYKGENVAVSCGGIKPSRLIVNGRATEAEHICDTLRFGANRIVAVYEDFGRTHLYLYDADAAKTDIPLCTSLKKRKPIAFAAKNEHKYGWLIFDGAPGIEGVRIDSAIPPAVFIDGVKVEAEYCNGEYISVFGCRPNGAVAALRFDLNNAVGGGALLNCPIKQMCGVGRVTSGDLSRCDGLRSYSGAVKYTARFTVNKRCGARYILQTERVVSSMRVEVNQEFAGTLFCAPWRLDVTDLLRDGENELSMTVYNTLANNYHTIPTRYRGALEYGIMTPVQILEEM